MVCIISKLSDTLAQLWLAAFRSRITCVVVNLPCSTSVTCEEWTAGRR
jgi:hypothetical protein